MNDGVRAIYMLEISRSSAILDLTGSYFQNSAVLGTPQFGNAQLIY